MKTFMLMTEQHKYHITVLENNFLMEISTVVTTYIKKKNSTCSFILEQISKIVEICKSGASR